MQGFFVNYLIDIWREVCIVLHAWDRLATRIIIYKPFWEILTMRHFYLAAIVALSGIQAACSNDNDNNSSSAKTIAEGAYTGALHTAEVNKDVASAYSNTISAAHDIVLASTNVLSVGLSNLPGSASVAAVNQSVEQNQSGDCENEAGKLSVTRDIDAATKQGSIDIQMQNCQTHNTTLDGSVKVDIKAYDKETDQPTSLGYTYTGLKIIQDNKEVILTGTLDAQQDIGKETSQTMINMHMLSEANQEQGLLQVTVDTEAKGAMVSTTTDGKICVGSTGCATVETVTPFMMDYFKGLTEGAMKVKGANESHIDLNAS
jgi:hypothetical protein